MLTIHSAASCSVPLIFSAASLLAKDPRSGEAVPWNPSPQRWIDGSVDNDIPTTRLAEMFNVNHFIVSQVNPHVVPFLVKEEDSIALEAQRTTSTVATGPTWLHSMTKLAKGEALHRMHVMAELGIFPNTLTKAVSVLSQKYSGDITIFPEISYTDFPAMLKNPTSDSMQQAMLAGERATWPKMSRIRNHCAIELALDDAVQRLRARVVFSPSQVDLRGSIIPRSNLSTNSNGSGRGRNRGSRGLSKASHSSEPFDSTSEETGGISGSLIRPSRAPANSGVLYPRAGGVTTGPNARQPSRRKVPIPTPLIIPPLDITTSGAETSNATISDSADDETSYSSSNASPTSTTSPNPWPSTRQLFPFASQPTTPSAAQRPLSSIAPSASTSVPRPPLVRKPTPTAVFNPLSMTPKDSAAANSPELRKKSSQQSSASLVLGCGLTSPVISKAAKVQGGSEIDISGTRAMMRRKRSSSSVNRLGSDTMDK